VYQNAPAIRRRRASAAIRSVSFSVWRTWSRFRIDRAAIARGDLDAVTAPVTFVTPTIRRVRDP
jgi:hypothetical protein